MPEGTDRHQRADRPVMTVIGLLSLLGYAVFVSSARAGGWIRVTGSPLALWWANALLVVFASMVLERPPDWPCDHRSRYLASANGLVVGCWVGASGTSPIALLLLLAYTVLERIAWLRHCPAKPPASYAPLWIWIGCIAAGVTAGYLIGVRLFAG